MAKFILGFHNPEDDFLTQYETKEKASYESEEWCEVEADSLEEAKDKYEETYLDWKNREQRFGGYKENTTK